MVNPIKPEKKSQFLNVAITASLEQQIIDLAKQHAANKSDVARYILEKFFTENSENPEVGLSSKNASDFENLGVAS